MFKTAKMMNQKYALDVPNQQQQAHNKLFNGVEENRQYLRAFIQTYRNLPVLWDTSLRDYTNRDKRAESYQQLVPIYRYLKRDATVEDVKKKINTLRTNYRKELKVVECARREGNVYQPRCWTFYELDFLRNAEKFLAKNPQVKSENSFIFNENSTNQYLDASLYGFRAVASTPPPNITEMFQKSFGQNHNSQHQQLKSIQPVSSNQALNLLGAPTLTNHGNEMTSQHYHLQQHQQQQQTQQQQQEHQQPANSSTFVNSLKRVRATTANSSNNVSRSPSHETIAMACDFLSACYPEEESLSRTWAYKLKRLPREQRLLAEKFINDILFEAESGTLHRGSIQLNAFENYVRFDDNPNEENIKNEKSQSPQLAAAAAAVAAAVAATVTTVATPTSATTTTTTSPDAGIAAAVVPVSALTSVAALSVTSAAATSPADRATENIITNGDLTSSQTPQMN